MLNLAEFWRRATEPPLQITQPELRRRSRLLLSIIAIFVILLTLTFVSIPLRIRLTVDPVQKHYLSTVYPFIQLAIAVALIISASFGRKGRYFVAARVLVGAASAIAFSDVLSSHSMDTIDFAIISVVLSSILLTPLDTIAVWAITVAGYLMLPGLLADVGSPNMVNVVILTTIIGAVSLGAMSVHRKDLSQIHEQTAQLAKNHDRLHDARKMEAIARLSSGLAHEFNNIMMAIRANAQIIERKANGGISEYATRINQSTVRAAHVTEGLLSFSEQQLLQPTTVDIDQVMEGHKLRLKASVRDNITLRVRPSTGQKTVNIDVDLFCEAIQTLVRKAQENIPGHGTITIRTEIADLLSGEELHLPAGSYCRVVISNSGPVPAEGGDNRLFEPFFTFGEFGTGDMDLAAAYGTVRQSGGVIETKLDPDLGATFVVMIPRQSSSV